MKHLSILTIGIGSIILLVAIWSEAFAGGPFTSTPNPKICTVTKVTATFNPNGGIRYKVMGNCADTPMTGEMSYGPNNKMKEAFYYAGNKITTAAICPADPWISGASCENAQISVKDGEPGDLLKYGVPLSRHAIKNVQMFQDAQDNATYPNPPGPPVNAQAKLWPGLKDLSGAVSWLGPDQGSPYGPYLHFSVEARPQNAQGAAWQQVSGIARHAKPDYRVSVTLPYSPPGTAGWEMRICSKTVLASTCTNPFIPTLKIAKERQGPALPKDPSKFDPKRSSPNAASSSLPKSSSGSSTNQASNPLSLPPKSFGKMRSTTPGSNTTLNPQPLPPRSFGIGSIMRRGIPEGEGATVENSAPDETQPSEVPAAEEKSAP